MNRFSVVIVMLLSGCLTAAKLPAATPEVENARQHGAQGEVTLHVVDSTGKPVKEATLSLAFWGSDSSADVVVSEGTTDTNGLFTATGRTIHSMNYTLTKEDCYTTEGTHWFYRQGEDCVQDGRWLPWNPTNTVVLKGHRNPIAMYAKNVDASLPLRDTPVGFDLQIGDWVVPYGKGKEADLFFAYTAEVQDVWNFSKQLSIACSNSNGVYRQVKDAWSTFRSEYEADTDGYQSQVVFSFATTRERTLTDQRIGPSEYLVFRVRTVLDDMGKIVSARYGKIYGPIEYGEGDNGQGGTVRFTYYLNPTANDRNLEFDPSRNLMSNPGRIPVNIP